MHTGARAQACWEHLSVHAQLCARPLRTPPHSPLSPPVDKCSDANYEDPLRDGFFDTIWSIRHTLPSLIGANGSKSAEAVACARTYACVCASCVTLGVFFLEDLSVCLYAQNGCILLMGLWEYEIKIEVGSRQTDKQAAVDNDKIMVNLKRQSDYFLRAKCVQD